MIAMTVLIIDEEVRQFCSLATKAKRGRKSVHAKHKSLLRKFESRSMNSNLGKSSDAFWDAGAAKSSSKILLQQCSDYRNFPISFDSLFVDLRYPIIAPSIDSFFSSFKLHASVLFLFRYST